MTLLTIRYQDRLSIMLHHCQTLLREPRVCLVMIKDYVIFPVSPKYDGPINWWTAVQLQEKRDIPRVSGVRCAEHLGRQGESDFDSHYRIVGRYEVNSRVANRGLALCG